MNDDLRALYQEVVFDHYRHPRNRRRPADAGLSAEGFNPLCGDRVRVYLTLDADGAIADAAFDGVGCAISTASASLMTEQLKGKTPRQALVLAEAFLSMLGAREAAGQAPGLGKLGVLAGVRAFPVRIKCATLAWHALRAALEGRREPVSSEE